MQCHARSAIPSEADLARIALEGAAVPPVVVAVGIGMKGGVLLVPEDRVEAVWNCSRSLKSGGEASRIDGARRIQYRRTRVKCRHREPRSLAP